ncbi:hypothetical protein BCHO_0508 [Bifidobacterium choerinum]|uniref:Uncharacterized protein n=1 Tax=Bifidobacterium choerinum TaxID=35760 RepID=A0A087AI62_9BIFI|nr:hypothetical protein BCHO_0508 [Bifidobacterium choerinum]
MLRCLLSMSDQRIVKGKRWILIGGQLIKHSDMLLMPLSGILLQIIQHDTTMTPDLGEGNMAILKQLHQRGPRDAQQIGSLLSRELSVVLDHIDGLSTRQQLSDTQQNSCEFGRQRTVLLAGNLEQREGKITLCGDIFKITICGIAQ